MLSYLLEYVVIFIGIRCHIYWDMLLKLLEYVVIFIGMRYHFYLLMNSNSYNNYIQNIISVKFL